jgi:hypothetical protein
MKMNKLNPYDLHLQYVFGWGHGAGSKPIDESRSKHSILEMATTYNNGYADGQKARKMAHVKSAKKFGVKMSPIRPMH